MGLSARAIELPLLYRLWQAPFADRKLQPVLRHNDLRAARRVLDVGCGPGTNTGHFLDADYVGVDVNPDYIASARRRYGKEFVVADVTALDPRDGHRADFVLVNSLLHHLDDDAARRVLASLRELVAPGGHVHVLDLVMPPRRSPARLLARWDRGDHARPLEHWRRLFTEHFEEVVFEPYPLGILGTTLWSMVYFKGA
jgi:SAM-dependent methyltransferase